MSGRVVKIDSGELRDFVALLKQFNADLENNSSAFKRSFAVWAKPGRIRNMPGLPRSLSVPCAT